MKKVVIYQGLPGSGKSTDARRALAESPFGSTVRINNDDLAAALFGDQWVGLSNKETRKIRGKILGQVRQEVLRTLLSMDEVDTVLVDNTNLFGQAITEIGRIADDSDAEVEFCKDFLNVWTETCIARDSQRPRSVGEKVIRDMAKNVERAKAFSYEAAAPVKAYNNDPLLTSAIIVDIDGTVAKMNGRSPHEYHKVGTDLPNWYVIDVVKGVANDLGCEIIFVSGRPDHCREATTAWLLHYLGWRGTLLMRASGDFRRDSIVKHEIFQREIAGKYHILGVFDDRDQVVRMWRKLGLQVFQVAEGNF